MTFKSCLCTYACCCVVRLLTACAEPKEHALEAGVDGPHAAQASDFDASIDASPPRDTDVREAAPVSEDATTEKDAALTSSSRSSLIEFREWSVLPAFADPFGDAPPAIVCTPAGYQPEMLDDEFVFSVDTGQCNYITAVQSTRATIPAGTVLHARVWHFQLTADAPAEAHVAVRIGELSVLDERVPIPGPGGLLLGTVTVVQEIPAGTPIYFHLHNHGANFWSIVEVSESSD